MALSSSRRSSMTSQHSAHSDIPRLSIDKRYSSDRRSSTDSTIRTPLPNLPGLSSLPGISSNSPLAPTGPRGMPPPTPPKDRLPPPQTPTRKPVQRQKSPLSSEAFSSASPALSMPGAFPTTPSPGPAVGLPSNTQSSATAYANNSPASSPAPAGSQFPTKGPGKRTSSLRDYLPFKALRKSYDHSSPENKTSPQNGGGAPRPGSSFGMRPSTPGGESILSKSTNQSSLKKKMSGNFWRRKSGLMMFGGGGDDDGASSMVTSNGGEGSVATSANETLVDDGRSPTPMMMMPGDDEGGVLRVKKRKSGTFWKRKSNLDLLDQSQQRQYDNMNGNGVGNNISGPVKMTDGQVNGQTNGHTNGHMNTTDEDILMTGTDSHQHTGYYENGETNGNGATPFATTQPRRSISPPPQLPAFVGGGGGLGFEPDMFQGL